MDHQESTFVICVRSEGYKAALEPRKIYRVVDDPVATRMALLRIVDESGEDYLYPARFFVPIEIPTAAVTAFRSAV